jgi:ubiquinone/menaquinone biosynthesis C-methylase UbiE
MGLPASQQRPSCFVELCLPWCHAGLVLPSLHRLKIPQALRYKERLFFSQTHPEIERRDGFLPISFMVMDVHRQKSMNSTYTGWRARWYDRMWGGYTSRTTAITLEMIDVSLLLRVPERFSRPPCALDIACGTGIVLQRLLEQVPGLQAYGLDASTEMLDQARRRLSNWPETRLIQATVGHGERAALPFPPQTFELIICTNALHYFPQPGPTIAECRQLLVADGQLVLEDFARRAAPFPWGAFELALRKLDPDHLQAYSLAEAQAFCTQAALQVQEACAFRINWLWQGWALRAQGKPTTAWSSSSAAR